MYSFMTPSFSGPTSWPAPVAGSSSSTAPSGVPEAPFGVPIFANAAYYPNWKIYKKQPPSSLRLGFVSHVFYAFAWY